MRKTIRLCVSLDEKTDKDLRNISEKRRQTLSQVVRDAVEFYKANIK